MEISKIKRVLAVGMMIFILSPTFAFANVSSSFLATVDKEEVAPGEEFVITLAGKNITDLYAFEVALLFDEKKLEMVGKPSVKIQGGFIAGPKKASDGKTYFSHTKIGEQPGLSGDLELCDIKFKAKVVGNHTIKIDSVQWVDSNTNSIDAELNKIVSIKVANKSNSTDDNYSGNSRSKSKNKGIERVKEPEKDKQIVQDKGTVRDKEPVQDKEPEKHKNEEIDKDFELVRGKPEKLTDIHNHWAKESINKVVKAGYMVGRNDTSFKPQENLTRAEMAVVLNRILPIKITATSQFKDIKGSEWYAQSILNMTGAGILAGYEDNTFKPKENIKRSEVMALLARVVKYNDGYVPVKDPDAILAGYKDFGNIPQWGKEDIAWCVQQGIIGGDEKGNLNTNAYITRAEIAAALSRILEF